MARSPKILVVEARFYEDIADQLVEGAGAVLDDAGIEYDRLSVPGVFEVPAAMRFVIRSMEIGSESARYAGFVALGCVIRGETDHYEHICREASRALMDLSITFSVAMGFGILTCDTYEQALARASVDGKNKGADAAHACLRMMDIKKSLRLLVPR
jgi:6,7-dimethyl-8-ribityllumazine synthase